MRDFGKVNSNIWKSKRFRALADPCAQLLYIYLHTTHHGNSIGCFYLPEAYIMADMGINKKSLDTGIDRGIDTGLIDYDREESIIYIDKFLKFSPINNKKHAIGSVRSSISLPDCKPKLLIMNELITSKYIKDDDELCADLGVEIKRLSNGYERGIPTKTQTQTQTQTETNPPTPQGGDLLNGVEKKVEVKTHRGKKLEGKKAEDFLRFWKAFNYKQGQAQAATSWGKIDDYSPELVETIILAARAQAKRRPTEDKTPQMAQGWLTKRRWEDDFDGSGNIDERLVEARKEAFLSGNWDKKWGDHDPSWEVEKVN